MIELDSSHANATLYSFPAIHLSKTKSFGFSSTCEASSKLYFIHSVLAFMLSANEELTSPQIKWFLCFHFLLFFVFFFPSCWSAHALSRSISTKMQIVIDNVKTRVMIPWYERDAFAWQGWGLWFAASSYECDIATTLI